MWCDKHHRKVSKEKVEKFCSRQRNKRGCIHLMGGIYAGPMRKMFNSGNRSSTRVGNLRMLRDEGENAPSGTKNHHHPHPPEM